ncbi:MAG: type II secretion system protein GspN [Bdellovibrionota bacterium]
MKRTVKQATIFLTLLLIVSLARLPYGSYRDRLVPRLKESGKRAGLLSVDASDIVVGFPATLTVSELSAMFAAGRVPLPLFIDSAVVEPYLMPLFGLNGKVHSLIKLYHGTVDVLAERGIFGKGGEVTAQGRNLDLNSYPLFQTIGAHGTLSFDLKAKAAQDVVTLADLDSAELQANITGADLGSGFQLYRIITIPPINQVEAHANAQFRKGRFVLELLDVKSSLGTVKGSGAGNLDAFNRIASGSASFSVSLTPDGTTAVGQYLALAAGMPVDGKIPSSWTVQVEFLVPNPRVTVRPA